MQKRPGEPDRLHILEGGFEIDHPCARGDVLGRPRPALTRIGAAWTLGPAFHGCMTQIRIHSDILCVEVFDCQAEVPRAAADVSGAAFDVVDSRRAVLFK